MFYNPKISCRNQYVLPFVDTYRSKLDVIENQLENHHPDVIKAINNSVRDLNLYPRPIAQPLINKLAKYVNCDPEQIILTNGSDSALKLLCECFIFKDNHVVILIPNYPHMLQFVETLTDNITYVPIDVKDDSIVICGKIASHMRENTSMVYMSLPNLPLGYNIEVDALERLTKSFPRALMIADCAYYEFGGLDYSPLLKYENFCIVRTFSKAFAIPSLRLGALIAHQNVKNYVQKIVNDKSVTEIAIRAGEAILDNLDYYLNLAQEVEQSKKYIAEELSKICHQDAPIFGYNVAGANFYLIYARDTKTVCKIFAEHGIYIRDKHSDVPNAIRICCGRKEQNEDVLDVCRFINLKSLIQRSKVIFDLDNTLRPYSKNSLRPYRGSAVLEKCDSYICTNNTSYTPDEISEYFQKYNVDIPSDKIYSPLTYMKTTLAGSKYSILGSDNIVKFFQEAKPFGENVDAVYLANKHFLDESTMIKLCQMGKKLFCTTGGLSIKLSDHADVDGFDDVKIPDIGCIGAILSDVLPVEFVGKPKNILTGDILESKQLIVVGDSSSDMEFAKKINALFIKIDPSEQAKCEFNNCMVIPSVDYLYSLFEF